MVDQRENQKNGTSHECEVEREKVVRPMPAELLAQDVGQLPASQKLVESGDLAVFIATAKQIPNVLYEIGRLREITFRSVGEGTGESIDLSWFDFHYFHLFLWNEAQKEVVGAYRIGQTDIILPRFGPHGLYTSKLFTYEDELLDYLTPGLELSRSFVRREYQRNYAALLLLWKGIGRFIVRNTRYKVLFGAVSISREYSYISRQLMLACLRMNYYQAELAKFAKAKNPPWAVRVPALTSRRNFFWKDIEKLSTWISAIEADQKGVPVLLRQYLRLGGKLLGFNRDKSFSNVWDGLVLLDLSQADAGVLKRYMGKDGAELFLKFHHAGRDGSTGFAQAQRQRAKG